MSLILCPECSGAVSSAATNCPHCGFPMSAQQNNVCIVNGTAVDLSDAFLIWKNAKQGDDSKIYGCKSIMKTANVGLIDATKIWNSINEHGCVPHEHKTTPLQFYDMPEKPKCPMCSSTHLTKKGAGARMIDGFFYGRHSVEGRAQWRCESCGHLW